MFRYALFALFLTVPLLAQDLSGFEKILLPGVTRGRIIGLDAGFAGAAVAVATTPAAYWPNIDGTFGTLTPYTPLIFPGTSRAGRIVHVERAHADDVAFDVTLFVGTANGMFDSITTLPVVREANLFSARTRIVNIGSLYDYVDIPGSSARTAVPRYRHHLRIYDVDARGDAQVVVRRYDQDFLEGLVLDETVVTLNQRDGSDPSFPAYAELNIPELCHPFSAHTPCTGGAQWIEIEPLTSGLRYWAMVSATDNINRQVSVKWPQ